MTQLGASDQSSAYTELANNPDRLGLSGFNMRPREGNITSVEIVVHVQEKANLKNNDKMEVTLPVLKLFFRCRWWWPMSGSITARARGCIYL